MAEQQQAAPAAPQPGTPEYDASMVAVADKAGATINGAPAAQPAAATRPEHVPEKFWDATTGQVKIDEVLKSYTELERKQAPAQPAPGQPPAAAQPVVADGKPNFEALTSEFAKDGKLSDASYTALEGVGIPKSAVDAYIAGQQALQSTRDAKGYEAAGGKESFDKMAAWAATALSPAEQAAINQALAGPEGMMKLAIAGLKSQYEAAMGSDPKLLGGTNQTGTGTQPFASTAEMTAAMRDPRYTSDAAYREQVYARVAGMQIGVTTRGSV